MKQPKHYVDREVRKPTDKLLSEFFSCLDRQAQISKIKENMDKQKDIMLQIFNLGMNIQEIGYKVFPLEGDE